MDATDAGEMAIIGAQIVEVGAKLNAARTELMAAQVKVTELEAQLSPLIAKHAAIIQKVVGGVVPSLTALAAPAPASFPPAPAQPTPGNRPQLSLAGEGTPQALPESKQLKARVKDYLSKKNPEGISASEVAEVLHIDPLIVREAMLEMKWAS
jgi:hypothetical protein